MGLELTDLRGRYPPTPRAIRRIFAFTDPGAEEDGDGSDELVVLFPNQLVRRGPG